MKQSSSYYDEERTRLPLKVLTSVTTTFWSGREEKKKVSLG